MKVVQFGGGIGNQLADYYNYLLIKQNNPDETIYIETLVYEIPEANETVCQWNGYEMERVFGLKLPNIMDIYSENEQKEIIKEIRETGFWIDKWEPHRAIVEVLSRHGFNYQIIGNIELDEKCSVKDRLHSKLHKYITQQSNNWISYSIKRLAWIMAGILYREERAESLFDRKEGDYYYLPTFAGIKSRQLMDSIYEELIRTLNFKPIEDDKNKEILDVIEKNNSVSIHARRSDYLQYNNDCYKFGYFKRAVKYIKKKVANPVFIVFSEDCDWCKSNSDKLGLVNNDKVYFVDWNRGRDSYRDLQLMSKCKHNVITKSSFGYWGCLLNCNKDSISCSQMGDYLTTKHF